MNKKLFSVLAILILIFSLSSCGEDITSADFLNPPQENGKIDGTWSSKNDELTIDQYFYDDYHFISIIQDTEEETWVSLGQWSWLEDKLMLKISKEYQYNADTSKWDEIAVRNDTLGGKITTKSTFNEITDEDKYNALVVLPDGKTQTFEFERGAADISIPEGNALKEIIDQFLATKVE